jgi:hypothetical protein
MMTDRSCMMFPNKYGTMIRVPREHRKPTSFEKKNEAMKNYVNEKLELEIMLFLVQNK